MEPETVSPEAAEVADEATERLTVRFTCRAVRDIRRLAHQHNRTFSGEVRQAVALHIERCRKLAERA